MDTNYSQRTNSINKVAIGKIQPKKVAVPNDSRLSQHSAQISPAASSAILASRMAEVKHAAKPTVQKVQENMQSKDVSSPKIINIFYFSDTHGELNGLTKIGAAKKACDECCGGSDNVAVLGAGDLIAGSQTPVINATVQVVNKIGMQATALGNHERGRSDEKLAQLNQEMLPDILALNASESDKSCSVIPSKICKQGDIEFLTVGAQPLEEVDNPLEIAAAIDEEVERIKSERREQGLNDNLPVVFLSHMGSGADKVVAENSKNVDVILGGHTHNVEEHNFQNKNGRNVHVLQGGKNNEYVTVVKLNLNDDGTVNASSKKIDIKQDETDICGQIQSFYNDEQSTEAMLESVKEAESEIAEIVASQVGPREDLADVKEGYGFENQPEANKEIRERNFSNPVANIMADAMLTATKQLGVQVSFFNAPSVKDTEIPKGPLTNYDVIGRMLPFGGEVVTADISIDKLYEMIELRAQGITTDGSQLMQVGGMVYSVDADKAQARNQARIDILTAEKNLKIAKSTGSDIEKAQADVINAKERYDSLPQCVEKILILNDDGSELKINPKAIKRGDFNGQTIKCAMNDFLAHEAGVDAVPSGKELTSVFKSQIKQIKQDNDGEFFVDQNEVRISIKDKSGKINGYEPSTGVNTKYWY